MKKCRIRVNFSTKNFAHMNNFQIKIKYFLNKIAYYTFKNMQKRLLDNGKENI